MSLLSGNNARGRHEGGEVVGLLGLGGGVEVNEREFAFQLAKHREAAVAPEPNQGFRNLLNGPLALVCRGRLGALCNSRGKNIFVQAERRDIGDVPLHRGRRSRRC
eukprot:9042774-Pyramimonas_sp.AAC.1